MRCAIRPLIWLAGLALFALAASTAHAVEAEDAAGTDASLEDTTGATGTDVDEDLLGNEFDDDVGTIGLEEGKVNFALQGANVRDFCTWYADRLDINIVLSPKVDGPMNITLKNVPWEIALRKALETHGYVLTVDENGIYTVLTEDEVALEPLKTEVYSLSYTRAEVAEKIIKPLLSERGSVQFDAEGNQLIISDVPARFPDIEKVINRLDRQIPLVSISVKLFEITETDGSDIGFKWSSLEAYKLTGSNIKRDYKHEKIRTDLDSTYVHEAWTQHLEPTQTPEIRTIAGDRYTGDTEMTTPTESVAKTVTKTMILSAADFELVFSALMRDDNTELLSQPKIATVDNKEAEIKVTRDIPIPNYTYNEETGSYEISDFETKEVGIKLNITPQVNEDNFITLDVQPELSTQYGSQIFVISGSEVAIPIVDTRRAQTRVIVKSGETLIIGGLTSQDDTVNITRVPLLSRIPVLGYLFKHKSTETIKTDLLITITPTLVNEEAE